MPKSKQDKKRNKSPRTQTRNSTALGQGYEIKTIPNKKDEEEEEKNAFNKNECVEEEAMKNEKLFQMTTK